MKRLIVIAAALCVVGAVQGQSSLTVLYRHMPVHAFVQATYKAQNECELLALSYWSELALEKYGRGDPKTAFAELSMCVTRNSDLPRDELMVALKYLAGKPSTSKALKEFYLKWLAQIGAMTPTYNETFKANRERIVKAEQELKASQKAMEIELHLGM